VGDRDRRIVIQIQHRQKQKLVRLSQRVGQVWWNISVILAMWETEIGGSRSKAGLSKSHENLSEK
jgi:hypothetical protein